MPHKSKGIVSGWGANAHVHVPPNFSAFGSVEEAVRLAAEENVRVLGASNYYDYRVYAQFKAEARKRGVYPLYGMEIIAFNEELAKGGVKTNDPDNPGRIYLCGKGIVKYEAMTKRAGELLGKMRRNDENRIREMVRLVGEAFREAGVETGLSYDGIVSEVTKKNGCERESVVLQERHLAQAYQEVLMARDHGELSNVKCKTANEKVRSEGSNNRRAGSAGASLREILAKVFGKEPKSRMDDAIGIQGEIRSNLMKAGKRAFVPERFLTEPEAMELVVELGGIPCYPTLADGAKPICEFEESPEGLVERMRERGIQLAEYIPVRNCPEVLERYVRFVRGSGIAIVAGTEHNTPEMKAMTPKCKDGVELSEEMKGIFWEGACVVAAHQARVARGESGFGGGEREIREFAREGEREITDQLSMGNRQ